MAYSLVPGINGHYALDLAAFASEMHDTVTATVAPGAVNVKSYGAYGKKETSTGTMSSGSATITAIEASKFPIGTWLAIDGAGYKATTGSITATSQTLTVASATGFEEGVFCRIVGAGFSGEDWYAEVLVVSGTTITIDAGAITTVAGAVVDLVEPTTLPAKLLGQVIAHPSGTSVTLDRQALTAVTGAAVSTDNYRPFKAAQDAMNAAIVPGGNFASRHGKVLYIPPGDLDASLGWGTWMCHRTIRIKRHMVVTGDVPNGALGTEGTVTLDFPQGTRAGILFESSGGVRSTGGNAAGSTLQNLRLNGGCDTESPIDTPSLFGQDHPRIWHPKTAYTKGQVRIPTTARTNDYTRVLVCVQTGTTAGTTTSDWNAEPDWDMNSYLGRIITDGTAKWMVSNNNAIEVLTSCQITSVLGVNWYGLGGVQWAASSPDIANLGTVTNVQAWFSGGGSLYIGQDANQVNIIGGNAFGNYGYGLVDESFLGNTFIGYHCQDNIRGSYRILNSTFINCYAEGAQGPAILGTNVKWIDGTRGAAAMDGFNDSGPGGRGPYWSPGLVVANNTCIYPTVDNGFFYWTQSGGTTGLVEPTWPLGRGRRVSGDGTVAWFCGGPSAYHVQSVYQVGSLMTPRQTQRGATGKLIDFWMGGRLTRDDEFLAMVDNLDGTWLQAAWTWINEMSGTGTHGFAWNRAFSNHGYGARPLLFLGPRAADADFDGQMCFPDGFTLGDRSVTPSYAGTTVRAARCVGALDAIPTSETFVRGDWFHFATPSAGGWLGAVCTASGTPGTWKRFGAIEP